MKQSNIILTGVAALVALVAITGVAISTFAQSSANTSANTSNASIERGMDKWQNLTDEQKTEMQAQMEARRLEMEATRTEIKTAMSEGYDAWVAAVKKAHGESAQILKQVTAENFAKYAEASGYMEQAKVYTEKAKTILDEIGVKGGMGSGMGKHEGRGMGMGMSAF